MPESVKRSEKLQKTVFLKKRKFATSGLIWKYKEKVEKQNFSAV